MVTFLRVDELKGLFQCTLQTMRAPTTVHWRYGEEGRQVVSDHERSLLRESPRTDRKEPYVGLRPFAEGNGEDSEVPSRYGHRKRDNNSVCQARPCCAGSFDGSGQ